MLNEGLRTAIEESLRQSCFDDDDSYDTRLHAVGAATRYGREHGAIGDPVSDEEHAAILVAVDTVIRQTPKQALMAHIELEFIAENYHMHQAYKKRGKLGQPSSGTERYGDFLGRDKSRPWVARLTGFDATYGYQRSFVTGQIDYSRANGPGSRGVFLHFWLKPGVYEVNERTSWRNVQRRFVRVEDMTITDMTREEVETWLKQA